jgi:Uma2 family endonuclease
MFRNELRGCDMAHASLVDLAEVPEKAELIRGRIVPMDCAGHIPNIIAGRIFRRLAEYADETASGVALTDNMGFAVTELKSGRESFSPDTAYYTGPLPNNLMRFIAGAPDFAVEVRSENDYGAVAEALLASKRQDYFEAGTKVVWDVDPKAGVVRCYRSGEIDPTVFVASDEADAEPAVPGWRVSVNWLMR